MSTAAETKAMNSSNAAPNASASGQEIALAPLVLLQIIVAALGTIGSIITITQALQSINKNSKEYQSLSPENQRAVDANKTSFNEAVRSGDRPAAAAAMSRIADIYDQQADKTGDPSLREKAVILRAISEKIKDGSLPLTTGYTHITKAVETFQTAQQSEQGEQAVANNDETQVATNKSVATATVSIGLSPYIIVEAVNLVNAALKYLGLDKLTDKNAVGVARKLLDAGVPNTMAEFALAQVYQRQGMSEEQSQQKAKEAVNQAATDKANGVSSSTTEKNPASAAATASNNPQQQIG
jgi:hypothetical protein